MLKLSLFMTLIFTQFYSINSHANVCDDPLRASVVCVKMQNLRSHIMMLESQRDLMVINYNYVRDVSTSLGQLALDITKDLPTELANHAPALNSINQQADEIKNLATEKDPTVFTFTNTLRSNCAQCHSNNNPPSGIKWDQIFNMDWNHIVATCNSNGRNPFICKQMYALVSNYSSLFTAYNAGLKNYKLAQTAAEEISRITSLLIENNFLHTRTEFLTQVQAKAQEVIRLAGNQDPTTFEKSYALASSCMNCHGNDLKNGGYARLNFWK